MQCPDCGYDVDDAAVFCPQCRYQFQETDEAPVVPDTTIPDTPVRYGEIDESIFEDRQKTFSDKEIRMLKIQLLQPAVLVVLLISLFTYSLVLTVPFIPITIAGLSFGVAGIICLICGLIAGILFYFLALRSFAKYR